MEPIYIAMVVIAVCVVVIVAGVFGIEYAKKKGINIGHIIGSAGNIADAANGAYDTLKPLFPQSKNCATVELVLQLATVGVNAAEKLYKLSMLDADNRKLYAWDFIEEALRYSGIEMNDEISNIVDGAITGAVAVLPKTHSDDGEIVR